MRDEKIILVAADVRSVKSSLGQVRLNHKSEILYSLILYNSCVPINVVKFNIHLPHPSP